MKNKGNSRKHAYVLQDHIKEGNTFYPPFTYKFGKSRFEQINWRADFVPELIWIALLLKDHGFDRAKDFACSLGFYADLSQYLPIKHDFGIISGYSKLDDVAKSYILKKLGSNNMIEPLRQSLLPLITLYPECPLAFITDGSDEKIAIEQAKEIIGPDLEEMLYRREKLPTYAQGICLEIQKSTGKMHFGSLLNIDILKKYPESQESQDEASRIRAAMNTLTLMDFSNKWAKYFWRRGREIGSCVILPQDDLFLGTIQQEFNLYHVECFRMYCDACNDLWEIIEKHYEIDYYDPLCDEILLGLACRIYRLTIHIVSFLPNWTEDIAEAFLRMIIESYIYYQWLKKKGQRQDFERFYEYGLGQQKLRMEHLTQYFQSQGLSAEEAKKQNMGMNFLKKHKMPEFVPVTIGNPLGKTLRVIAQEADCREIYALVYSPASSAVHGMYDSLDLFYSRTCANPFHCLHKVPYHWSKSPISGYGPINCLILTDWILSDIISSLNQDLPDEMPGEKFLRELNSKEDFERFAERDDVKEWIEKTDSFRSRFENGAKE